MKCLASKLNNRIELWSKEKVETDIGNEVKEVLKKKLWADIIPKSGNIKSGEVETEFSNVKFQIRIRKVDIKYSDYFVFKGQKYEIEYIFPDFNRNSFLDILVKLKVE